MSRGSVQITIENHLECRGAQYPRGALSRMFGLDQTSMNEAYSRNDGCETAGRQLSVTLILNSSANSPQQLHQLR